MRMLATAGRSEGVSRQMFNCNHDDPRTLLQRRLDGDRARVSDDSCCDSGCCNSRSSTASSVGSIFGSQSTRSSGASAAKGSGMFADPPCK